MKVWCALIILINSFAAASTADADTVVLKNADHFTGTIVGSDGDTLTLKTDAAGEIKVQWPAVKELTSEMPLFVVTSDKKTVTGKITLEGTDLVVHTASADELHVPLTQLTIVRSGADQASYEKSLHPSLLADWKGGVTVGFALARGNSDTTNLSTGLNANRKTLSDEIKVYASSIYTDNGRSNSGAPTGVTADEIVGGVRFDRNIGPWLFAFASGAFTHDALQHLEVQQIYTGGLGWHAINKPNTTFDVLAGINYVRETYSSSVTVATPRGASLARNLPGITAGEDFTHKLGASTTFTEEFEFYPDLSDISQYRFAFNSGTVTQIKKWLGWQVTFSDHYITNPPIVGTVQSDAILSTGLNISFSHQ
jgi:putative salt-induced outer membrane protein YdiY